MQQPEQRSRVQEQRPDRQSRPPPQDSHATPPVPQLSLDVPLWQELPSQQPVGQLVASQTQLPPTHRCPLEHRSLPPHSQLPPLHRSERRSQPPPPAHLQAPVAGEHVSPGRHATHLAPPLPHALVVSPGMQVPPMQQPEGQPAGSHSHVPSMQRSPPAQALPLPQTQSPAGEHVSARLVSQAEQTDPATPHASTAGPRQTTPSQQPAHDMSSHAQAPPTQR